ncbi:hypothetical protein NE865_13170 [Phthorimaea operculella]|nr:hypothetical protein NE865_13170 [Phthorimaea operculella]
MESFTPPHVNADDSTDEGIKDLPTTSKSRKRGKGSKKKSKQKSKNKRERKYRRTKRRDSTASSSEESTTKRKSRSKKRSTKDSSTSSSSSSNSSRSPSPKKRKTGKSLKIEDLISALKRDKSSFGQGSQIIPEFNPQMKNQTMKDWLRKINESAAVYGWNETQTIYFALPRLTGLSKKWYDGLTSVKYSWKEWQEKLLKAFPCEENYGDLLAEMLSRKSRRNETLEEYYYEKIRLINRCEIKGLKAVDCLTQGIFDHNIRLNAQGSGFKEPEEVLSFFRKITQKKEDVMPKQNYFRDKSTLPHQRQSDRNSSSDAKTITYNCFNCDGSSEKKFFKNVTVNDIQIEAFVDFGSECSLLSEKVFDKIKESSKIIITGECPILKGFGHGAAKPKACVTVRVKVDELEKDIDMYVLPNQLIPNNADALIGQNYTELPNSHALKTDDELILYQNPDITSTKVMVQEDVCINGVAVVKTKLDLNAKFVYINSDICMKPNMEYILVPDPINDDIVASVRDKTAQHIQEKQNDMADRFNSKRCPAKTYSVGDLVLVQKQQNNPGDSNKLLPPYSGPFKISKVLPNDRYEVTSIDGYTRRKYVNVYAAEKIKPWISFSASESGKDDIGNTDSSSDSSD